MPTWRKSANSQSQHYTNRQLNSTGLQQSFVPAIQKEENVRKNLGLPRQTPVSSFKDLAQASASASSYNSYALPRIGENGLEGIPSQQLPVKQQAQVAENSRANGFEFVVSLELTPKSENTAKWESIIAVNAGSKVKKDNWSVKPFSKEDFHKNSNNCKRRDTILLDTSIFDIKIKEDIKLYIYDVRFACMRNGEIKDRVVDGPFKSKAFWEAFSQHQIRFPKAHQLVFDGDSVVYSRKVLGFGRNRGGIKNHCYFCFDGSRYAMWITNKRKEILPSQPKTDREIELLEHFLNSLILNRNRVAHKEFLVTDRGLVTWRGSKLCETALGAAAICTGVRTEVTADLRLGLTLHCYLDHEVSNTRKTIPHMFYEFQQGKLIPEFDDKNLEVLRQKAVNQNYLNQLYQSLKNRPLMVEYPDEYPTAKLVWILSIHNRPAFEQRLGRTLWSPTIKDYFEHKKNIRLSAPFLPCAYVVDLKGNREWVPMEFLSTPNSDCELPEPDPDVKERLLAVNQSKINALELLQELCCSEENIPIFCKEDIFTQNFGVCISPNFHNHSATYMEPIYSTVEDPNLLPDKKPNDSTSLEWKMLTKPAKSTLLISLCCTVIKNEQLGVFIVISLSYNTDIAMKKFHGISMANLRLNRPRKQRKSWKDFTNTMRMIMNQYKEVNKILPAQIVMMFAGSGKKNNEILVRHIKNGLGKIQKECYRKQQTKPTITVMAVEERWAQLIPDKNMSPENRKLCSNAEGRLLLNLNWSSVKYNSFSLLKPGEKLEKCSNYCVFVDTWRPLLGWERICHMLQYANNEEKANDLPEPLAQAIHYANGICTNITHCLQSNCKLVRHALPRALKKMTEYLQKSKPM